MANTSFSQQALATDARFKLRLQAALVKVALEVLAEAPPPSNHAARASFASKILASSFQMTQQIAYVIVERTNLLAFNTSYDFAAGCVVTAAGDADIESQLHTDWDILMLQGS